MQKITRYGFMPRVGKLSATIAARKKPQGDFVLFSDHVARIVEKDERIEKLKKRVADLEKMLDLLGGDE